MNKSELRARVIATGSHFFDHKSMKFFGDTMKNYGVTSATITILGGEVVECWELFRRRPVKYGLNTSAYFRKDNFDDVHPVTQQGE